MITVTVHEDTKEPESPRTILVARFTIFSLTCLLILTLEQIVSEVSIGQKQMEGRLLES